MPLFEYVLLALIASGGGAGLPTEKPETILGPEAIVQPNGGALLAAQDIPPKKEDSKDRHPMFKHTLRHGHKHRHRRPRPQTPKKDGGT
jgi:hypothetical protein